MIGVLFIKYAKGVKINVCSKNYVLLYATFLFLMTLAHIANGEITQFNYLNFLTGMYLIPLIVYYATFLYVKNEKDIRKLLRVIGFIIILTSFATALQYYNNPLGWAIPATFNSGGLSEWQEFVIDRFSSANTMSGHSYQVGIFAYGFMNAAFLCSVTPLFLYPLLDEGNNYSSSFKFFCMIIVGIGFIGCYMTQQRAAFIGMFLIVLYLFAKFKKHLFWISSIVAILVGVGLINYLVSLPSDSFGRIGEYEGMTNDSRYSIWTRTTSYLSENLLWGGHLGLGIDPHNLFLNAFIYGGLLGGLIMVILVIYYTVNSFKCLFMKNTRYSFSIFCGGALLVFTFTGLFHNVSIVNGSDLCFLLLSLMTISYDWARSRNVLHSKRLK